MTGAEKTGNAPPQIFIRIINPQLQLRSRLLLKPCCFRIYRSF
jgi:hypothetical protein